MAARAASARCPRAARPAGGTVATRGPAAAAHCHPVSVERVAGARVCAGACGRTTARPPPRSRSALSVRRAVVPPLQPRRRGRRAQRSARRLPEEREPPGPSRPLAAPPPPSHAATAAVSFCATKRSCSLPPTRLRRRCVLRCDPPRWQQRALLVPLPASGPGATSCRRRGTLASRLATRCRPGRGAVRCLDGGSASGADARFGARSGGVSGRMPAALPVPVCPRRSAAGLRAAAAAGALGAALLPRHVVAARAASALPTRGSAGGRHYRRSCTSRGRPSPPRLSGGGRRALACACGCATLEGAVGAAATAAALLSTAPRLPLRPR
jgi:hypothetical protein